MWQITWMLSLLPDWFWTSVLIAGVLGTLASWVLRFIPFIKTYLLPIQVGSILLLLVGVYFQGAISNEEKWQAKVKELEQRIEAAKVESAAVNQAVETKVITKTKVVKEKADTIIKYIDKEVVKEIIKFEETCPIPKEAIDVHNEAARMNKAVEEMRKGASK